MKKLGLYIFILMLFFLSIFSSAEEKQNEDLVDLALKKSGAQMKEVNINSYVIFKNTYIPIDKGKQICDDISESLNLSALDSKIYKEEGFFQITIEGKFEKDIYTTIILQSSQFDDFKESSIVLDVVSTKSELDFQEVCDTIRNVLKTYGNPNLNINLTGCYDGFKDTVEIEKIINGIFTEIKAEKVEGIIDENVVSITGYVENLKDYITVGGKKVNINIAGRYNSYEDKTYIWIGTPLIVTEY
ncbi:TATA-box binding [Caminicella sporogenes DSM 14501]|uniref:TATA-box binding n=2 Tax=Caminicella TaxID=166484 RepID=A0A1M6PUC4_9FIRM|nr:YwmB family TATA-box binding protein [Caminicella sporogenes]RKD21972.1 hypothetical protein BET04_06895 [Caminicella sporogenes]SHK11516.1 TATA-box binding [Caminicella sporogenes DSM 14501]